ncbi:MAG: BON domain-containing protein, partial [Rickettsiales bacterium]|nr:BON domain-containing protein [Rickettsiales bacterium]
LAFILTITVAGCAPAAVVGGTGALGLTVAQERSLGNAIDDTTITTAINSLYLQKDINYLFEDVDVQAHEGRVLLTGEVPTADDRVEAVRLAWQPQGVREVINEIEIREKPSPKEYAADTWITTQIKTKLLFVEQVRSINYSVDTVNGIVYLLGIAQDKKELQTVADISSRVKGVKKVVSYVKLKDDPSRF